MELSFGKVMEWKFKLKRKEFFTKINITVQLII